MKKEVKVYHYTSLEVLKKILFSQRLRFTRMNSLNDRSEYKYGIQLLKNKIIEYETNNNIKNRFDANLLDKFSFTDKLYSLSFTENGDNLAFWNSYYVDKTAPISIGFKSNIIFNIRETLTLELNLPRHTPSPLCGHKLLCLSYEKMMDILLVFDKEKTTINVVKGID